MELEYQTKYFINPGIDTGIRSYLNYLEGNEYERIHTFEMYVIKALTIIYGTRPILLPYKIDNEKAFECNLLMYDLKESDMKNFIKYMNSYYEFIENYKEDRKLTGLMNEIEKILIEMINKRSKKKPFSDEEIREFDMIFNPHEGDLKRLKSLVSTGNGLIIRTWEMSKDGFTNTQLNLMVVHENLLHPSIYSRFGFDIRNVAKLTSDEIDSLNRKIKVEEDRIEKEKPKKTFKRHVFAGNGFVAKIVILSIIIVGLIGLIIFSLKAGGKL